MSEFKFTCPHCQQHLSADSSMVGTEVACPTCSGRLIVPEPPTSQHRVTPPRSEVGGTCPYCRAEITPTDRTRVCPACHTPHHADCWKENKGCTVFGCSMAPPDEEKISVHLIPSNPASRPQHIPSSNPRVPSPQRPPVPTYLGQSIAVTLLCCMPFGIAAIVNAAQVNSKLKAGDYEGAVASSNSAKKWGWVAFWAGLAVGVIQVIITISNS